MSKFEQDIENKKKDLENAEKTKNTETLLEDKKKNLGPVGNPIQDAKPKEAFTLEIEIEKKKERLKKVGLRSMDELKAEDQEMALKEGRASIFPHELI